MIAFVACIVGTAHATQCGPNPGGQNVTRRDGTSYPYFGMPCGRGSDCGNCFLDTTCTCDATGCCAANAGPPGYVCLANGTDLVGSVCVSGDMGAGKTTGQLAALCDAANMAGGVGCWGFNNNGFLKTCVRQSCGAKPSALPGHPLLVSCVSTATPTAQPAPSGTDPSCHHGPAPAPLPPPYGGRCVTTAYKPECNCSGAHPPFGPPKQEVEVLPDYHFPAAEAAERASLVAPELLSATPSSAVTLRNPATHETIVLAVGGAATAWGWELLLAGDGAAVLEHDFDEWGEVRFLWVGGNGSTSDVSVRKPVGRLPAIAQPLYDMASTIDPDYFCKEDIDPTDWIGRLAANISGGEEASLAAANTLIAPNSDSGIFGNPEDWNSFYLTHQSELRAMPFPHDGRVLWQLAGSKHVPAGCEAVTEWEQLKMGQVGGHLRVLNQGMWHPTDASGGGCGVEIMAVSPPSLGGAGRAGNPGANTTTALLRISSLSTSASANTSTTSYLRATVLDNGHGALTLDELGGNGTAFYAALLAQKVRWGAFTGRGAQASLPQEDRRYTASANALMTMYMNTDRGLLPSYGAGQFWNEYNVWIPLNTLALVGALLEWGHTGEGLQYLGYFWTHFVCMDKVCIEPVVHQYGKDFGGNVTFGQIKYSIFGCDSDADYGRLLDMYVQAVRYSGNMSWATEMLPFVQTMASYVLAKRAAAEEAYPAGHPFHGLVYGSPEHDICTAPSFFFSLNVWFVRGLTSLAQLHREYPSLTRNATLEAALLPAATAWRADVRFAANFTAVRRSDGSGLFFLHPVVGSAYSEANPPFDTPVVPAPIEGGDEATCVARGTCFASMTAGVAGQPGGGSNQNTNYANFRVFPETLLAQVLDDEYELAIVSFRNAHRGSLLGMTRFRDVLDDMPVLGWGRGALAHDRLFAFHNALSGHSMGYISRGTYWGTEQRQQLDYSVGNRTGIVDHRWRNDCGVGGEDCSLCMVSGIAPAFWVRWMLASDDPDTDLLFVARGAPRRWYVAGGAQGGQQEVEPFGIAGAPTRFGKVTFTMQAAAALRAASTTASAVRGSFSLERPAGAAASVLPLVAVKIRAASAGTPMDGACVLQGDGVEQVAWHPTNETAVFRLGGAATAFNFTCTFA